MEPGRWEAGISQRWGLTPTLSVLAALAHTSSITKGSEPGVPGGWANKSDFFPHQLPKPFSPPQPCHVLPIAGITVSPRGAGKEQPVPLSGHHSLIWLPFWLQRASTSQVREAWSGAALQGNLPGQPLF